MRQQAVRAIGKLTQGTVLESRKTAPSQPLCDCEGYVQQKQAPRASSPGNSLGAALREPCGAPQPGKTQCWQQGRHRKPRAPPAPGVRGSGGAAAGARAPSGRRDGVWSRLLPSRSAIHGDPLHRRHDKLRGGSRPRSATPAGEGGAPPAALTAASSNQSTACSRFPRPSLFPRLLSQRRVDWPATCPGSAGPHFRPLLGDEAPPGSFRVAGSISGSAAALLG